MCDNTSGEVLVVVGNVIPGKHVEPPLPKGVARGSVRTDNDYVATDSMDRAEEKLIEDARARGANVVTDLQFVRVVRVEHENHLMLVGNAWYAKHLDTANGQHRRIGYTADQVASGIGSA
jgi:hypothetical protein